MGLFCKPGMPGQYRTRLLLLVPSLASELPIFILRDLTVLILALGLMTCVNLSKSLSSLGATRLTFVKQNSDWSPDQSSHCPPPPPVERFLSPAKQLCP